MKKMNVVAPVTAAALPLASVSLDAGATAVYGWYPVNENVPYPVPSYGQLEVTDAAYRAGSMNYYFGRYDEGVTDPYSPIIAIEFGWSLLQPRVADGTNHWSVDAYVHFGEYLTGTIVVNNLDTTYWMYDMYNTAPPLWEVSYITDDATECHAEFCQGATGYWKLESGPEPIPAPEPDPIVAFGLLAFGLLGVDMARGSQRWLERGQVHFPTSAGAGADEVR